MGVGEGRSLDTSVDGRGGALAYLDLGPDLPCAAAGLAVRTGRAEGRLTPLPEFARHLEGLFRFLQAAPGGVGRAGGGSEELVRLLQAAPG